MKKILCLLNIHRYKHYKEDKKFNFLLGQRNILVQKNQVIKVRKCSDCNKKDYKIRENWKPYKFKTPIKEVRLDKLKEIFRKNRHLK